MFSFEFCEICKNTFFAEHLRMTAYVQYILDLAEKGIYCCENPEAAAVGVLQKKAYNLIKNDLFRKKSVNGCLWKSAHNFPKEGFLFNFIAS